LAGRFADIGDVLCEQSPFGAADPAKLYPISRDTGQIEQFGDDFDSSRNGYITILVMAFT
jgi:hypothetical protein